MEDYIIYNGEKIEYKINKGKRKNIYIYVLNGKVEVRTPKIITKLFIKQIVKKHAKDIIRKLNIQKEKSECLEYKNGSEIKLLGEKYKLNIIYMVNKRSKYSIRNNEEIIIDIYLNNEYKSKVNKDEQEEIKKVLNKIYKEITIKNVNTLMPKLSKKVGLYPNSYKVKKAKTIWGSCSSKKNISINQELAKYDIRALEYVIIHELCHIKYMNHSKKFWDLVKLNMPDYKEVEKILKPKR